MTDYQTLIDEAREWSSNYASWGDNGLVDRLADALEESTKPQDEWCREESCQYRYWRSGSMPTHLYGSGCPERGELT